MSETVLRSLVDSLVNNMEFPERMGSSMQGVSNTHVIDSVARRAIAERGNTFMETFMEEQANLAVLAAKLPIGAVPGSIIGWGAGLGLGAIIASRSPLHPMMESSPGRI